MDTAQPEESAQEPTVEEAEAMADQQEEAETTADQQEVADGPSNLHLLLDIPLEISVEMGRSKIMIGELLKLGQGSVVELDKLVDEPMDILVNQKPIARGEVVVSNDRFGVRLTDVLEPAERLEKLR